MIAYIRYIQTYIQYITLRRITLHCITYIHYIYITLHYTTLHYIHTNNTTSHTDPTKGKGARRRPVSAISWCSDGGSKIAIAYCSPEFLGTMEGTPTEGYTFNVEDPTKHCEVLDCTSPLTSLAYSPKDPHLLAGGSYSGQICWWDVRQVGW